jgi:DnaK suppressor protein
MAFAKYRKILLAKEQELLDSLQRKAPGGRERSELVGVDSGDQSVFSEHKESIFAESHRHTRLLNKVRQALKRMDDGTYGRCIEDGEKIEAVRLDSVPWTPYCLRHQSEQDNRNKEE